MTRANTFAEAERLGRLLGQAVAQAVARADYELGRPLAVQQAFLDLPVRQFGSATEATAALATAAERLERLRAAGASRTEVRTAECDWFGAEKALQLARAAADGRMAAAVRACLPAEIQVLALGPCSLVAWPGEVFVEYALRLAAACPRAFLATLANGELQGYLVTPAADRARCYEAGNSVFDPTGGEKLLAQTLALLGQAPAARP